MISELKTFYRIYADTRNENTGKIVAKQNDTKTRYLDITVTDNGVPVDLTGCEVRIYGRKKDGTEFYNNGTLQDATTGRCLFEATTQMLAYAGQNVNCEIVVFKDNEQILSTMPFDIFVVESLMGASAIESSNEYGALVILYQNLYEAIDLMTTMVQNIGSPSTVAEQYNLETMWQAWEFLTDYMKTDLTQMISDALANASVQGVLDKIGDTADTGGSFTEGTLMAKENAVLEKVKDVETNIVKELKDPFRGGLLTKYVSVSSEGTHISIAGKGKLYYAYASIPVAENGSSTYTIKLDGVVVASGKMTSSYDGTSTMICQLFNPRFNTVDSKTAIYRYHAKGGVGYVTSNAPGYNSILDTNTALCELSETTVSVSNSNYGGYRISWMIKDYLEFNESLEIISSGGTSNRRFICGYSLDE